jgi:hypothetical protein
MFQTLREGFGVIGHECREVCCCGGGTRCL